MSSLHIIPMLLAFSQVEADEVSLESMQRRAQESRLSFPAESAAKAQFVSKPLFRYSDQLRGIQDAAMFLWTDRGRPVAAMKIEQYKPGVHPRPWLYCFTSLSTELVKAEWDGRSPFQARKPGVTWKVLDDKPANSRSARLVQMRDIARRFSAEVLRVPSTAELHQMRLLPRPLYRYDEGLTEVEDGAVFGFTGTGTNPDLLLLLDLTKDGRWQFGLAGMSAEGLTVRLNDMEVWQQPHTAGKGHVFDNWTYFAPEK